MLLFCSSPELLLSGSPLERVHSFKYLGVDLESCPSNWKKHCQRVLKKARGIVFSFRTFYSQLTSRDVILQVFRSIARPVLEYGAELVLPNSYFSYQFERLQRFSVSSYRRKYNYNDSEYLSTLVSLNLAPLANRRAAAGICHLMKVVLGVIDVPLTCICFGDMMKRRQSSRLGGSNDILFFAETAGRTLWLHP